MLRKVVSLIPWSHLANWFTNKGAEYKFSIWWAALSLSIFQCGAVRRYRRRHQEKVEPAALMHSPSIHVASGCCYTQEAVSLWHQWQLQESCMWKYNPCHFTAFFFPFLLPMFFLGSLEVAECQSIQQAESNEVITGIQAYSADDAHPPLPMRTRTHAHVNARAHTHTSWQVYSAGSTWLWADINMLFGNHFGSFSASKTQFNTKTQVGLMANSIFFNSQENPSAKKKPLITNNWVKCVVCSALIYTVWQNTAYFSLPIDNVLWAALTVSREQSIVSL